MTNALISDSFKYPFDPISYLSKYFLSSPQTNSMKASSSALTPGTLDGFGWSLIFFGDSSVMVRPLPKYCLMKFMYSNNVIHPSLLVSIIWKTLVRSSLSGLNLRKKVLSLTKAMKV